MPANSAGLKAVVASQQRPSHTLYCSNLPDRLQKDDLKRALYMLFSTYGPILDIVALKTPKMRGQAHVLFRDVQASTQALRALQGHEFFGKEMKVLYASSKSDTLAKLDGTYKQPDAVSQTQASSLQQSIFAGPPGDLPAVVTGAPGTQPPNGTDSGLAPPPSSNIVSSVPVNQSSSNTVATASQGLKRARDEDEDEAEDENEDAAMEMDDDAMDESDE